MSGFPNYYEGGLEAASATGLAGWSGLGSSNTDWVNGFQNPFNKGPLAQASALSASDKAAAYNLLAPAFAKIQQDAAAFIANAPNRSAAQQTIDGWHSDFPLINGMLDAWRPYAMGPAAAAPGSITVINGTPYDTSVMAPSLVTASGGGALVPATAAQAGGQFFPGVPNVNVSIPGNAGAGAGDMSATLMEWAPWIGGAAILGLLLSSGKSSGKRASTNRPRRRRR